jgi:hypothetical protein
VTSRHAIVWRAGSAAVSRPAARVETGAVVPAPAVRHARITQSVMGNVSSGSEERPVPTRAVRLGLGARTSCLMGDAFLFANGALMTLVDRTAGCAWFEDGTGLPPSALAAAIGVIAGAGEGAPTGDGAGMIARGLAVTRVDTGRPAMEERAITACAGALGRLVQAPRMTVTAMAVPAAMAKPVRRPTVPGRGGVASSTGAGV